MLNPAPRTNASVNVVDMPQNHHGSPRRRYYAGTAPGNDTAGHNHTVNEAREIVRLAQKEANLRNIERFKNPRVNTYYDGLHSKAAIKARDADMKALTVNKTVAAAAALVAEVDAANSTRTDYSKYSSLPPEIAELRRKMLGPEFDKEENKLTKRITSSEYWLEHIDHVGKVPYGGSANNDYKVFRNVRDYGAKVRFPSPSLSPVGINF